MIRSWLRKSRGLFTRPYKSLVRPTSHFRFLLGYEDLKAVDSIVATFQNLTSNLWLEEKPFGATDRATKYVLLSHAIMDAVTSGILVIEKSGRVGLINRWGKIHLGFESNGSLIGSNIESMFSEWSGLRSLIDMSLRDGTGFSRQCVRVTTVHGEKVDIGVNLSPIVSRNGEPEALIMVFTRLADEISRTEALPRAGYRDYYDWISDLERLMSDLSSKIEILKESDLKASQINARLEDLLQRVNWSKSCLMVLRAECEDTPGQYADVEINDLLLSVLRRRGLESSPKVSLHLSSRLPRVNVSAGALALGLELLLIGSLRECDKGVAVMTGIDRVSGRVTVVIEEQGESPDLASVSCSVKELISRCGLYRELAMVLLRMCLGASAISVTRSNGFYCFSCAIFVPKHAKAGKGCQKQRKLKGENGPQ